MPRALRLQPSKPQCPRAQHDMPNSLDLDWMVPLEVFFASPVCPLGISALRWRLVESLIDYRGTFPRRVPSDHTTISVISHKSRVKACEYVTPLA